MNVRLSDRRRERGFTLIELLVSLIGGLIVAMAVVALSGTATNTFHEEARAAAAEMALRVAVDRLRGDIQRAAFMGTGNIQSDPKVPLNPTGLRPKAPVGLAALSGLRLIQNGSLGVTPLSSIAASSGNSFGNNFSPDALEISGNLTSPDQYVIKAIATTGNCQRLTLAVDSPAMWRVRQSGDPATTLANMFQPVAGQTFLVRVSDDLGRYEFFETCSAATTSYAAGSPPVAYVDIASLNVIYTANYGFIDGRLSVSPVQTVRWDVRPVTASTDPSYRGLATDSNKYNLVREYVDPKTGAPFVFANTKPSNPVELVAEYAVDFKVGFTVDVGDYTQPTPSSNTLSTYPIGDPANATVGAAVSSAGARPQRIRSVRVRLSTRSAMPDRAADIRLPNTDTYTLRYCVNDAGAPCTNGQRSWARVRTVNTEVALPNQARAFY